MLPTNDPAYSALLLEFVEPLTREPELENAVLERCRFGMTVWNLYVSKKYNLQMHAAVEHVVKKANAESGDFQHVVDFLLTRKQELFDQYDHIILTVEKRHKPDGSSSIYVESAPAQVIQQFDVSEVVEKIKSR